MQKLTETERQKMVEKFSQLHQFLEEQEKRLLNEIEEMEKEITRRRDEHLATLSKELSSLERSIQEMEEKSQQPASELLQDVRSTLQRCQQRETFKDPMAFPPELNRKISNFWVANPILYVEMKEIKGNEWLQGFSLDNKLVRKLNMSGSYCILFTLATSSNRSCRVSFWVS
nr:tripartite motif-containing protein 10-like [Zootoca vivipara]